MRVYSFFKRNLELEPIEIEVSFVPGIPTFQLTGLPDAAIKESILRLKSALRHQGFRLPTREQVLFHLRPTHERKSSQGLDLALAAAYLYKTEQLKPPDCEGRIFLYGELALDGEIKKPEDLDLLESMPAKDILITGEGECAVARGVGKDLRGLASLKWCEEQFSTPPPFIDTSFDSLSFCKHSAEALRIAATGEHNTFMAGPQGSGKSTFAHAIHSLLRAPTREEWRQIEKIQRLTRAPAMDSARPFVAPHHSSTDVALLGGGTPAVPGEITRAHNGTLLLDEFMEYTPHVVEALREPIERHEITILRKGIKTTFPANFLLIAATNLCPCGEFVPNFTSRCQRSKTYCRSYFDRLSVPLIDRFDVVTFTHTWTHKKVVTVADLRDEVRAAQEFALKSRGQKVLNSRLGLAELENKMSLFTLKNLIPTELNSQRRRLALLRVARTIADLRSSKDIELRHLNEAEEFTHKPFLDFRRAYN
jgi:magnesium chelatase family protein